MNTVDIRPALTLPLNADPQQLAAATPDSLLNLIEQVECGQRRLQAFRCQALSSLARHRDYRDAPVENLAAVELACALRISESAAQAQLHEAEILTKVFPEALEQLAAGEVQITQVRALIEATANLDEATARAVQEKVLALMPRQNPAATRRALSRAVLKVDPQGAEQRREAARKDRGVAHYPKPDGMSEVVATLPAEQAAHAMAVVDAHARASKQESPGDKRTLDQARADSLYHLVTGCEREYPAALVCVTVPLDTLLGVDQEPGELTGYGPITADTARALAAQSDSLWQRLLTAPGTGITVKAEPAKYRPTAEVRRYVSARDGQCTFPTCAMPAAKSDLDHVVPFNHRRPESGGLTVPENLQVLCRRHHRIKHEAGWDVQLGETYGNVWTSPSGRQYSKAA